MYNCLCKCGTLSKLDNWSSSSQIKFRTIYDNSLIKTGILALIGESIHSSTSITVTTTGLKKKNYHTYKFWL